MTPAEAQALQDRAQARGMWLMWFVSVSGGQALNGQQLAARWAYVIGIVHAADPPLATRGM